jgi:hypothetical protein
MTPLRSRAQLLAAVLLAGALSGSALATTTPEVRVVRDAAGCGGVGFTLLESPVHRSCVHSVGDLYDGRAQAAWLGKAPATAPPVCYGDGQTGARVQLVYGYVAGQKNRAATVVPQVRAVMAPRMQAMIKAASAGKDLGIRFAYDTGCRSMSVPVVAFPASVVSGKDANVAEAQFTKMIAHLQKLGFDRTDRKYEVVWDWWNSAGVCGLGELVPDLDQPTGANVHNGVPTVGARTDAVKALTLQNSVPSARYSGVWRNAFGPRGVSCWDLGQSGAEVQVHELMHTLGAVQLSAPHSDGGGHCTDTPSVMCPGSGGARPAVPACAVQKVQVLDCGMDDFWNPNPAQGSYLSTGDNIATSQFFGPQAQDRLVASPI